VGGVHPRPLTHVLAVQVGIRSDVQHLAAVLVGQHVAVAQPIELPTLVIAAAAGHLLHVGAVDGRAARYFQALAALLGLDLVVAVAHAQQHPTLVVAAVAGPLDDVGTVGAGATGHVDATAALPGLDQVGADVGAGFS